MLATFQLSVFAALALFFTKGAVAQVPNCAQTYTVKPGDTCNAIAAAQSVSTYQLETVNNATVDAGCDNLQVGQRLCLAIINEACEPVHVVIDGDNCTSVAEQAGTTIATMVANNPNLGSDCTALGIGLVVCVAKDVVVGA